MMMMIRLLARKMGLAAVSMLVAITGAIVGLLVGDFIATNMAYWFVNTLK